MLYSNLPDYRNRLNTVQPRPLTPRGPTPVIRQTPLRGPLPSVVAAPKRSRARGTWITVFIVALLGFTLLSGSVFPRSIVRAFSSLTTSSEEKAAVAAKVRLDAYAANVNNLVAARPGENIAVSTVDLSDGSALTLGDPGTFTGASTAKLITAITLLHEVENDNLSLTRTIDSQSAQTLLQQMIVDSDNAAWQSLNDYLTHDTLQGYMASLGWTEYDPDVNTLLPADMASLMQQLYTGKLLNKSNTDLLLSYMKDANKQEYIVDGVLSTANGYTVYHKAGWLDGLMHDVAIINKGDKTIVLAIYSYSSDKQGDSVANEELFKSVANAALKAYFPKSQ